MGTIQGKAKRATVWMDPDVLAKARAAVQATPGLTLARLISDAVQKELKRRERQRGEAFEVTNVRLPPGRPPTVKSTEPLPPRKPIMTFEEMMREYEDDRKAR